MGLHGKLVTAVEFKAGGDVFHELFSNKPHHVSTTAPLRIQGCDLLEGEYGKVGSKVCWRYTRAGKQMTDTVRIQLIDNENKRIEFKNLEGNLMEEYKDFLVTLQIEKKRETIELVTWTLEYETFNDDVNHPIEMLCFFIDLTKDIETHHLAN